MSALDTVERAAVSSLPASSGMQLDSILNALASITPPVPPPAVAPPAPSATAAAPPRAPVQAAATIPAYSSNSGGVSPRSHANITQVTAHNFYNNTFDDPAWYKSHSQTVHADMGAQPRTPSVKAQHTNPNEAIVDAAKKFYNNAEEGVGPDGREKWAPVSHEHLTFRPLDKSMRPYSSPPSGKPSGLEERMNQQAQILWQQQQQLRQRQEQEQATGGASDAVFELPAAATTAKSSSESQEYYLDKRTIAKLAENDGKNVYTRGNVHIRPQKSTRYFKDFLLSTNSPLQFSSDYVPPPPPPVAPATSGDAPETAGMTSKVDQEVRRSARRSATHILNRALKESMQDEKEKRNDRFSRRALRQKAAADLPETAYVPQMATNQSYLRYQLNKKDDSQSGYVNFDEFRSSLKQADILLTYEEYLDVFNKFTKSASSDQVPVPVTVQNQNPQRFSPPASGGRMDLQAPHPESDKALRERFKGVVGVMSTGKVLNIEEFLHTVQSKAKQLAAAADAGSAAGSSNEAISRIADQASNKEKRRVFFKVLHSMNKHADPSKVFRHLDGERVGYLQPATLRVGLNHLGASLSDCEFNTLLQGVGYGDAQGQSYIDLHRFDKVLHEELDAQAQTQAQVPAGVGAGGSSSSSSSASNAITGGIPASSSEQQQQHLHHQHRRTKKSVTVPGHGQFLQHHPREYDNDESGLTSKITQVEAPSPRGFGSKETFVGIQEQLAQLASSAGTDAKSASRLKKMQSLLECLQPQRSEFSRMVDSQHTKDSSMKWSKLKWALQSDPQRVLRAFVPSSGAANNLADFNKNKAAAAATKTEKRLQKDHVHVQDLQQLSVRDLDMQLHNSGFVLGAEDRNILRFRLQSAVGNGQEGAGGSDMITLQSFCDTVGIPLREHRGRSSSVGRSGGSSSTAPPSQAQLVSWRGTEVADGGIFACSNPNASSAVEAPAAQSESLGTATAAATANSTFGTQVTIFNDDSVDPWMKGMHKRRLHAPGAPTQSRTEPWKYLALLEHGSDAIWPTVPAAKADASVSGNFHFSKRLFAVPQTNPLYGDYDDSAAQAQARAASSSRKHFSARSSSAPPSSRQVHAKPGWANSDQFKAAQAEFAAAGAEESRGRSARRGQVGDSSSSDADKVRRWASGPLLDHYQAAPAATQHEHASVFSAAPVDSSRLLKHTLRKAHPNNPNCRPPTTPFALDI
jgi:Ca2+-binding EF-hand superfamily protein